MLSLSKHGYSQTVDFTIHSPCIRMRLPSDRRFLLTDHPLVVAKDAGIPQRADRRFVQTQQIPQYVVRMLS